MCCHAQYLLGVCTQCTPPHNAASVASGFKNHPPSGLKLPHQLGLTLHVVDGPVLGDLLPVVPYFVLQEIQPIHRDRALRKVVHQVHQRQSAGGGKLMAVFIP